jgi:hypothetical protein
MHEAWGKRRSFSYRARKDVVVDPAPFGRVGVDRVEACVDGQAVDNAARPRLAVDRDLAVPAHKQLHERLHRRRASPRSS